MDILATVRQLSLPLGKYAVAGSGPLGVRGIRESKDVDILVLPDLFDQLKNQEGWEEVPIRDTSRKLLKDNLEIMSDLWVNDFRPTNEELIARADTIDGIPFLSLDDVRAFKRALGREKDLRDIELIERYLESHTS